MAQSSKQYMDRQNHFIGDQAHVRNAWDISVKVIKSNLTAKTVSLTADWNAVMTNGKVPCFVGAVWMKNFLGPAAPKTKGMWRVCRAPGGAGNSGGSFLGVTKYCKRPRTPSDPLSDDSLALETACSSTTGSRCRIRSGRTS